MNNHRFFYIYYLTVLCFLIASQQIAFAQATPSSADIACSPEKPTVFSNEEVRLNTWLEVPQGKNISYHWASTAGNIQGNGESVTWKFQAADIGLQEATVAVKGLNRSMSCLISVFVKAPKRGQTSNKSFHERESGWSTLIDKQLEEKGYGLYSYILLATRPTDATIERYRKVIQSYLFATPEMKELEKEILLQGDTRLDLNITYLLLKQSPPASGMTIDWVLENYSYAKARALLRKLPGQHRDGPYIISSFTPFFSDGRLSDNILTQNLSFVPAHIVHVWAREYFNQTAQERYWEVKGIRRIALSLRKTVAVLAAPVPSIRNAIDDWIKWTG